MKAFLNLTIAVALLMVASCDLIDKDDDPKPGATFDQSELEGNIVISNHSNHALALYLNGEVFRKIPNSSTDFLIWIPNPADQTFDLQLYKYDDVAPNFEPNLDISMVYKRWNINLSNSKNIEKRVTWHITQNAEQRNSGKLVFSYVGGTDNQVDVFLNSRNGAKIITLKPGDQYDNIVGIDYGAYTLHFRYWYSDPNTPDDMSTIGWIETEVVSGHDVDIWAVINEFRSSFDIWIPHWENANVIPDIRGTIRVTNNYIEPLRIYANGQLIENIIYLDGNEQAASIVPRETVVDFIVEGDKEYYLAARPLNSSNLIADATINLEIGNMTKWKIYLDDDGNIISEVTGK
jgi:hypothetical protein